MIQMYLNKTMTSAAQAMYAMLQYTDKKDLSLTEIMGYSSHAFRINIHPESVSPAGPTMFAPYELISQNLKTLGVTTFTSSEVTPLSDKDLADTIRMAEARIDTGVPIISWDLFSPEFGLIYGYDHEKQIFYAKDKVKDSTIKYTDLNERSFNHLFLCGYYESISKSMPIMLRDALLKIIEHAEGKSPFASYEYKHGLEGFDAWIQAFKTRKIDPFGNAYNLAVVTDARQHAEHFFNLLLEKWDRSTEADRQVIEKLAEAKMIYQKVATYFKELQTMFPYPHGGDPNDYSNSLEAIKLLQHAYDWEKEGIEVLKKLKSLLNKYEDNYYKTPFLATKQFEFAGVNHRSTQEQLESDIQHQMFELMKRDESIVSRITNCKILAFDSKQQQEDVVSYIVARPVSFKPYNLPYDMQYYHMEDHFACIRVQTKEKMKGYEVLKNWIAKEGFEKRIVCTLLNLYSLLDIEAQTMK